KGTRTILAESTAEHGERSALQQQRWQLLRNYNRITERPLVALSVAWLVLVVIDLAAGLPPGLNWLTYGIWLVFVLDFVAGVLIAPSQRRFLRRNWLSGVALILPALGALRVFRIVRAL